jgi:hypothetical protein
MMYKLTDQNMRTYGGFQWELGKEVTTSGAGAYAVPAGCIAIPIRFWR